MKTFKQYLIEASNLSNDDKETIQSLLLKCYISDRRDINIWLDTIVYNFIIKKSNHTNSDFFTQEEIINVKGQKDIRDVFNDNNNELLIRITNVSKYLNKTYTIEQASIKYGNKLERLSFIDAEKEYNEASQKVLEIEGVDYKVIKKYSDGYKMVSLLTQKSLDREGDCMGHCTNNERQGYLKAIQDKIIKVISLRDNKNKPHATLHYEISTHSIRQINGNGNGPVVPKYIPYILKYLNSHKFNTIKELHNINTIQLNKKLYDMDHIPSDLVITTNIDLRGLQLTKLPQFPETIYGSFDCSLNKLTSLKGCPLYIKEGLFYCNFNELENLEHGPRYVNNNFDCSNNKKLVSLEHMPSYIGRNFYCKNIGKKFTEKEIRELSDIEGQIEL